MIRNPQSNPTHTRTYNREDSHGRLSESGSAQAAAAAPTLCGQTLYRLPGLGATLLKAWRPGFWVLWGERLLVYESRAAYEQSKAASSSSSSSPSAKKQVALVDEGLLAGELKYKDYGARFGSLHHFTLEERRDGATSTVIKFASTDRSALAFLRDALQARLSEAVKRRLDYAVKVVGSAGPRQTIIDNLVMKERTASAAAAAAAGADRS